MIPVQYIVVACWAIFALYWFISASSVKPTQATKGWLAGNWHSIWLLIGGLFLSNASFLAEVGVPSSWLTVLLIPRSIEMNVVIVVFAVSGLIVTMVARRTLAGNWSRAVAFKRPRTDHDVPLSLRAASDLHRHLTHGFGLDTVRWDAERGYRIRRHSPRPLV